MPGDSLTLCVFIDAFGYELLQRHSFLDQVLPVKEPLDTIFGYSATCDPTILTGVLPRDHGHFSFYVYDPANSPFAWARALAWLPSALAERGRVRHWISRLAKPVLGYTGYFQLYAMPFRLLPYFDYTEKRDLYQPGGINSGASTFFDELRDAGIPFYLSDWRKPEEINLQTLTAALRDRHPRFAYLYLAAMDAILHRDGTGARSVADKIAWYDRQLRGILELAWRAYDTVTLYVFSDHGMTDVTECCDLMTAIDKLNLRFGIDYAAVYDSTMARFWFLREKARASIQGLLSEEGRGVILSEDDLHTFGCDFPDRRYGELFFMLHPGVLLCPSHMGRAPLAAMHGYHPDHHDSLASFSASSRPAALPCRLDNLRRLMHESVFGDHV